MLRKMITKVLKGLVRRLEGNVEKKTEVAVELCTVAKEEPRRAIKLHDTHKEINTNVNKMNTYELKEWTDKCLEEISASLFVKGYKELPEILSEYDTHVVQSYVLSQLVQLGQYSPEEDNLDSFSKAQLIDKALENNQLLWRQRMIEQGKAEASQKQIETIKNLCERAKVKYVEPKDRFEASDMIDKLIKRLGINTKDNSASEAQKHAIEVLCKKLGKNLAISEVACDSKTASSTIQLLQKELEQHPELNITSLATAKQVEYVKRLLNMQKKRWTAKRQEEYSSMTAQEISKAIKDLEKQNVELGYINDNATEGQVNFILSLGSILKKNYSKEEVSKLNKKRASEIIDTLQREQLYMLYLGNKQNITKEEIKNMKLETVRELIKQFNDERRTDYYERSADDYTSTQNCL